MSEEIIGERTIQMDWICRFCKHRNRGLEGPEEGMRCASCSHPKDAEEYLMPDDTASSPSVTDPHLLELADAGENWKCGQCGCEVRAKHEQCQNCGAKRHQPQPQEPLHEPREEPEAPKEQKVKRKCDEP